MTPPEDAADIKGLESEGIGRLADTAGTTAMRPTTAGNLPWQSLAALGVVFGDIGTSPLYTLKTVLELTGGTTDRGDRPRRAVAD